MTSVLLIYPFFKPRRDRSVFRFPPLGISYIAATLRSAGHRVRILDCTFLSRQEALEQALKMNSPVVGIYCMVSMVDDCLSFAKKLRHQCGMLVAGGPLPTCDPLPFLDHFDVVVSGEGEQTMVELIRAYEDRRDLASVAGIVYRNKSVGKTPARENIRFTERRPFAVDLDALPFPARDLLPNRNYIAHGKKKYGHSITTVMSSRGCPFQCEFCSNVIFGGSYRERSPRNVVDEIEAALGLGYDRISFGDDVFTLKAERVLEICDEIGRRGLRFEWECLGRVDAMNGSIALAMKRAGCRRIYFGIESGSDPILKLMNKRITTAQARAAVECAHEAGLEVGAFFILFYPGDTNDSVLATMRFASSLPLDYLGLTMPYPLPGTDLYKRTKRRIKRGWRPDESVFGGHVLLFDADFSEMKMWFGIMKGHAQFYIKRKPGKLSSLALRLFEGPTDALLRLLR